MKKIVDYDHIQSKENKSEYYIAIVDVLGLLLKEYGKEF